MINIKTVKQHIPNIALILSFGSTNYGLRTPSSDYDYVIYVVPTIEEMYDWAKINRSVKIDGDDYEIRSLVGLSGDIKRANMKTLEILGAKDKIVNTKTDLWKWIEKHKHQLANQPPVLGKLNKDINEKYFRLKNNKPVQETNEGYERQQLYGFDTKYLMHGMRLIYLREAVFGENRSFVNAIDLSRDVEWWSVLKDRIPELLDIKVNKDGLDNLTAAAMMEPLLGKEYSGVTVDCDEALLKELDERVKKECKRW